jgi:8-oxo-dGTP pyrophosphatase MutT (NUDIX family)
MSTIPIKKSYGIILCRVIAGKIETLLVHKKYTYAYAAFVLGKYSKPNLWPTNSLNCIIDLLRQMTLDELLDIWSLNFKQIWYRAWLNTYDTDIYKRKYVKFYNSFIKQDNGTFLKKCIRQITACGSLIWEPPRGRCLNSQELDINCAIREVKEETGFNKQDYTILPNVKRYVNYVSLNVRYICTYYIAIMNPRVRYYRQSIFNDLTRFTEVGEIKWFNINTIRLIDDDKKHIESLIKPAFTLVKKYITGNWITKNRNIKTLPEINDVES